MIAIAVLILRAALGLALAVPRILTSEKILTGLAIAVVAVLLAVPTEEARAHDAHTGNYPLHDAASRGQVSVVVHLLGDEHNIAVNATTSFGTTPLHRAADASGESYSPCNPAVVMTLIAVGANVNAKKNNGSTSLVNGNTPLVESLIGGVDCPDVVEALLDAGADVCRGQGCEGVSNYSPLGLLGAYGKGENDLAVAGSLIRRGHDVNDGGGFSYTPLYWAWYQATVGSSGSGGHGWFGLVDLLVENGAHYGRVCENGFSVNPRPDNPRRFGPNGDECICPMDTHTVVDRQCEAIAICDSPSTRNESTNRCECFTPNVVVDSGCQIPSADSCGALSPPQFYNAANPSCDPIPECHSGAARNAETNQCEFSTESCAAVYLHYNGTGCEPRARCHWTAVRNTETNQCECPPELPFMRGNRCEALVNCESPQTRNEETNACQCVAPARWQGYSYFRECVCRSPNFILDDVCQAPGQASCAAVEKHYNGRTCEPLHPCHETALRKADNSGCECPPDKPFSHEEDPSTSVRVVCYAHSEHSPIPHSHLVRAVEDNNLELVVHHLNEHGTSPDRYRYNGYYYYPLSTVAQHDYHQIAATLIAAGANVNRGFPLYHAAISNSFRVAEMLLANGAEIGSAFHAAAELGHMEVVAVFINAGANLNKRISGKTPLDLARENGYRAVMIRLAAAGGNWGDPCTGGKVANPHARPQDGVPECVCQVGTLDRNNDGVCESDSDENIAAQLAALRKELTDLRAELAMLRATLPTSDENAMVRLRELSARAYAAEQGIRILGGDPGKAGVWRVEIEVPAGQRFWAEPVSGCRVREWEGCAGTGVPGGLGERKSCRPSGTGRATVGVVFACD